MRLREEQRSVKERRREGHLPLSGLELSSVSSVHSRGSCLIWRERISPYLTLTHPESPLFISDPPFMADGAVRSPEPLLNPKTIVPQH